MTEATIFRWSRRIHVLIVGADGITRQSTFANDPPARREAIRWCKRMGVDQYQIR